MTVEHVAAATAEQFPPEGVPEVAFLGRSNVGKSSLLNSLAGSGEPARISSQPGCTRLIHFYRLDDRLRLVDLPGYGFARVDEPTRKSWKRLIESYLLGRESLRLSVLLLDARRGWMQQDLELKRWLEFHNRRYLVVATKMDKLNQSEQVRGLAAIREQSPESGPVPFSAVTGRGAREIWQTIARTWTV